MRNKNPSARWFCFTLVWSVAWLLVGTTKADNSNVYDFDIPSQGIESALSQLAEQTSTMLLFPYDTVQFEKSKPVIGSCTLNDDLITG